MQWCSSKEREPGGGRNNDIIYIPGNLTSGWSSKTLVHNVIVTVDWQWSPAHQIDILLPGKQFIFVLKQHYHSVQLLCNWLFLQVNNFCATLQVLSEHKISKLVVSTVQSYTIIIIL